MKSIIQDERRCFLCRTVTGLDEHHILAGSYKKVAEELGLKVYLCRSCHKRVQESEADMQKLREIGQLKAMKYYKWTADQFRGVTGMNFLKGEKYEKPDGLHEYERKSVDR